MNNFNVYVIHSAKPLDELKSLLENCGGYTYAGIIYRSSRKKTIGQGVITEKEETRKTIVFCPPQTIQQLELSHPAYKNKIADYNWSSFPTPNEAQGETWHLHISGVPNDYTVKEAEHLVTSSLDCILPPKSSQDTFNYIVDFSPRLRETGEIFGFGHITFDESVDRERIKLCKLILHNTPVCFKTKAGGAKRMVTCVWHRPPQPESRIQPSGSYKILERARPATVQQVDVSGLDQTTSLPTVSTSN